MIELTLPWPPSVNRYWRNVQGRTIISAEGRSYRERVFHQMLAQSVVHKVAEPIKVTIEAYRPDNRRRDLDNLLKATLDALAVAGVYNDDSQIVDLHIYWAKDIGGMLKVKIEVAE